MPQEFQIVHCYSCQTFQVHHVKKSTKWTCKMCGEKQSLKKVYGRGSGADCRQHVQRLNTMRGELDQGAPNSFSHVTLKPQNRSEAFDSCQIQTYCDAESDSATATKWNAFVENDHVDIINDDDDDDGDGDDIYTTDAKMFKQSRKRKREMKGSNSKQNRNGNWAEFSNISDFEKSSLYSSDQCKNEKIGQSRSQLTKVSGFNKGYKKSEGESNPEYSSFRSNKWCSTFKPNESSSQESISSSYDEYLTAGVDKTKLGQKTYNVPYRPSKGSNCKLDVRSNKWDSYTEEDVYTNETSDDNSQECFEGNIDSRPYISVDPNSIKDSRIVTSYQKEKVGNKSDRNSFEYEIRHDDGAIEDVNSKQNANLSKSKWSGFLSSIETQNLSEEINSNPSKSMFAGFSSSAKIQNQCQQNNVSNQSKSKWSGFSSYSEKQTQSQDYSTCQSKWSGLLSATEHGAQCLNANQENEMKNVKQTGNNWSTYGNENIIDNDECKPQESSVKEIQNCNETHLSKGSIGSNIQVQLKVPGVRDTKCFQSMDSRLNIDKSITDPVKPIFTAGDLDDFDFEL